MQSTIAQSSLIDVYMVGACETSAFSLSQAERLRRSLAGTIPFHFHDSPDQAPSAANVLVVRADWVIEKRILQSLIANGNAVLKERSKEWFAYVAAFVPAQRANDAIKLLSNQPSIPPPWLDRFKVGSGAEMGGAYERQLRKRQPPVATELNERTRDAVERALFRSAYKGATDFVTKYLWPVPAFHTVRFLARRGISPNAITFISLACVLATFVLFCLGHFWPGLAFAYLMAFLDTVDGKLARVTLTSSRIGHLLDHGIDLISPPFWWAAWFVGVLGSAWAATGVFQDWAWPAFWSVMALYWLVRGIEALFSAHFGIHIHTWQPIDFAFRQITTRRNVNITILAVGTLFGRPDVAFLALAVWALVSFLFHSTRLGQALLKQARGSEVRSWLNDPLPKNRAAA